MRRAICETAGISKIRSSVIIVSMHNPYADLTAAFNQSRLRAVLSSGQAVDRIVVRRAEGVLPFVPEEKNDRNGR